MNRLISKLFIIIFICGFYDTALAKPRIYYAHPITLYGTPKEKEDIDLLTALGFEVVNPNDPEMERRYQESHSFEVFLELVRTCDLLAFRSFPDGSIGAGIAKEIEAAREKQAPIIELPTGICQRTLSVDETREFLRESGYHKK